MEWQGAALLLAVNWSPGSIARKMCVGQVISVELPNTVELEVVETDPGVRGNTAVSGRALMGHPAVRASRRCLPSWSASPHPPLLRRLVAASPPK